MVFRSRLVNFIFNRSNRNTQDLLLYNKSQFSLDKFTQVLFLLLIGFLVGNLFGTFLNTIRKYITWDGIIVFFIIGIIEISNYNVYHNKTAQLPNDRELLLLQEVRLYNKRISLTKQSFVKQSRVKTFWKFFNFFKIGLMVGFFVDAFKVGS